jgi:hypothetical protein
MDARTQERTARPPYELVLRKITRHKRGYGQNSPRYIATVRKWRFHFQNVIYDVLRNAGEFNFPIDFAPLERYCSGFEVQYHEIPQDERAALLGGQEEIEEGWHYVDVAKGIIHIFYDPQVTKARQRFTIAHEWAHVLQHFDQSFKSDIEALPETDERCRIIESVANHTAAFYLVPRVILDQQIREVAEACTPNGYASALADRFNVSQEMMTNCLMNFTPIKKR